MADEGLDPHLDDKQQTVYKHFHDYDFEGDARFQSGWKRIEPTIHEQERLYSELLKAKLYFYSRVYEEVTLETYKQWLNCNKKEITVDKYTVDPLKNVELKQSSEDQTLSTVKCLEKEGNILQDNLPQKTEVRHCVKDHVELNEQAISESNVTNDVTKSCETDNYKKDDNVKNNKNGNLNSEIAKCESSDEKLDKTDRGNCERNRECENKDVVKCESEEMKDSDAEAPVLSFSEIAEMLEKGLTLPGVEHLNIEPTNMNPCPSMMNRLKKPWEK